MKSHPVGMTDAQKWLSKFMPIHAVLMSTSNHGWPAVAIRVYNFECNVTRSSLGGNGGEKKRGERKKREEKGRA